MLEKDWSYVTLLDKKQGQKTKSIQLLSKIIFEKNFQIRFYFKKKYYRMTKFQRKIMMRRKHFSLWLYYINVMYQWSTDYKFFKNYYKLLLNLNLFKWNLIFIYAPGFSKTSIFPFNLVYYLKGSLNNKRTLSHLLFNSTAQVSWPSTKDLDLIDKSNFFNFLYLKSQNHYYLNTKKKIIFILMN